MQNDSNRGSVKSTVSMSGARLLLTSEVRRSSFSMYSVETVSSSLLLLLVLRVMSVSTACEHLGDPKDVAFFNSSDSMSVSSRLSGLSMDGSFSLPPAENI